ncbi:MAG: hypothetical protein WC860_05535 [Candidatus Margulisiibacteriota bacterium]|jgi:hexokinase
MQKKFISLCSTSTFTLDREKDLLICNDLLISSLKMFDKHPFFTDQQKENLKRILDLTFKAAFEYFEKGTKFNFIFHNILVCNLMIKIGIAENLAYQEFRNAMLLGLLHDIGNAKTVGKKYSRAMIKEQLQKNNLEKASSFAKSTIDFRFEHMKKAGPLIKAVTESLVTNNLITTEDLDLIIAAANVHDYPSIEGVIEETKALGLDLPYKKGDFLFSHNQTPLGRLTMLIREADTLFILTWQGILADLIHEGKKINLKSIQEKLTYNINKFYEEFQKYQGSKKDDGLFYGKTLLRTNAGYRLFSQTKSALQIQEKINDLKCQSIINPEKLEKVLKEVKSSFTISLPQIIRFLDNYKKEIELGILGKSKYFQMSPTYITFPENQITHKKTEEFFAIDFGGSTLRLLKMRLFPKPELIFVKKVILDDKVKSIKNSHALFDYLAKQIKQMLEEEPNLSDAKLNVGFSFSYPLEYTAGNKTKILEWSKGFSAHDAIGQDPVVLFQTALAENKVNNLAIKAIANDAVTVLLSGYQNPDSDLGMIIGTSTNISLKLPVDKIKKSIGEYKNKEMIVVFDSSSRFSYADEDFFTRFDQEINGLVNADGTNRIGKLYSGNYLGNILRVILKHSTDIKNLDHLLFKNNDFLAKLLTDISLLGDLKIKSKLNSLFKEHKLDLKISDDASAKKLREISQLIIQRAGILASLFIIGAIKFIDPELSKFHTAVIDGSVFSKNKLFREQIYKTFAALNIKNITLQEVADGSGIGAGILSLSKNVEAM